MLSGKQNFNTKTQVLKITFTNIDHTYSIRGQQQLCQHDWKCYADSVQLGKRHFATRKLAVLQETLAAGNTMPEKSMPRGYMDKPLEKLIQRQSKQSPTTAGGLTFFSENDKLRPMNSTRNGSSVFNKDQLSQVDTWHYPETDPKVRKKKVTQHVQANEQDHLPHEPLFCMKTCQYCQF